jgi:hypothetical protein
MLTLTGITRAHRDHSLRNALRGPAILAFCLGLAVAFLASVWHGPAISSSPSHTPDKARASVVIDPS